MTVMTHCAGLHRCILRGICHMISKHTPHNETQVELHAEKKEHKITGYSVSSKYAVHICVHIWSFQKH